MEERHPIYLELWSIDLQRERERDLVVCPIPFCRKVPISTSAQKDQDVWTLIAYTFCPACPRVWAWGSPPHAPHPSHLQSPPMSHYTKDVWVFLGTVARSTHFWRRLREGGVPGEENKNLLEGRSAMASYLIRGSILSSPLHNFESHSSGDQERYNEFIFKVFFFFSYCVLIWKTVKPWIMWETSSRVVPSANLFSKEIQDCLTFRGRWGKHDTKARMTCVSCDPAEMILTLWI